MAALQTALAYCIGRPIERQQIQTHTIRDDGEAATLALLRRSPALRAAYRRLADLAERDAVAIPAVQGGPV